MLKSKALLIDRLKKLHELVGAPGDVARQVLGKEFDAHLERIQGALDQIAGQELIVPIVGSFSAGKSSLINALIGEPLLPVAITPETALPTELRFADKEWLQAVRSDGKEERHLVSDLRAVQERASERSPQTVGPSLPRSFHGCGQSGGASREGNLRPSATRRLCD